MDEKTEKSTIEPTSGSAAQVAAMQTTSVVPEKHEVPEREHRQSYGTAKTENLHDSGLWRIMLPSAVVIFCAALVIIPLGILIPLLYNAVHALSTGGIEGQLIWLWVTLIVIEMGIVYMVLRGIFRIFLTQAGNYQH